MCFLDADFRLLDFGQSCYCRRSLFNQFFRIEANAVARFVFQLVPNCLKFGVERKIFAEQLFFLLIAVLDVFGGKFNTAFVFVFILQVCGKRFVAFVRHYGQYVHLFIFIAHAPPFLIDGYTQPAPDFLTLFQ